MLFSLVFMRMCVNMICFNYLTWFYFCVFFFICLQLTGIKFQRERKEREILKKICISNQSLHFVSIFTDTGTSTHIPRYTLEHRQVYLIQMYALLCELWVNFNAMVIVNGLRVEAPQDISMPMCLEANFTLHASGTKPS